MKRLLTTVNCSTNPKIPYQLVSMAAIIRNFDTPIYKDIEHERLTDIADSIYEMDITPDMMKPEYKELYYQYDESFWNNVFDDMAAIDSQLNNQSKEDELLADYNDRIGITATTKICADTDNINNHRKYFVEYRYEEDSEVIYDNGSLSIDKVWCINGRGDIVPKTTIYEVCEDGNVWKQFNTLSEARKFIKQYI